jgi:threonyl-tRNA synthetase
MQKIPYLIVLGDKEIEEKMITIEKRGMEKGEKISLVDFAKNIVEEIKTRS